MDQRGILISLATRSKRFFYKHSIFQLLDVQKYERKVGKYEHDTMMTKIKYAVNSQLIVQFKKLCIVILLPYIVSTLLKEKPASSKLTDLSFMTIVVICPLIEEVVFRGILQNLLKKGQQHLPTQLASASLRVALIGALFACVHLPNGGDYLSKTRAIAQCAAIMLYPNFSSLYEKTGSFVPGLIAHMTNNFICYSICKLRGF